MLDENAFIIRPTMEDGLAHQVDRGRINCAIVARPDDAYNSTHDLSFHTRVRYSLARQVQRVCTESSEPVISEIARIAFPAVTGGENNVHHFPGSDKVQRLFPLPGSFNQILEKLLHQATQDT